MKEICHECIRDHPQYYYMCPTNAQCMLIHGVFVGHI